MRLHLIQCERDTGHIWTETCVFLHFFIVQCFKVILRRCVEDRCIDLRCRCDRIADRDLTVSPVTGHAIPLVTHQAGRAKDTVDLLLHIAAPEAEHGNKRHICIGLRIVAFLPVSLIECFEFITGSRGGCVCDNALIIQIGCRLDRLIGYTGAALHEGVEQIA